MKAGFSQAPGNVRSVAPANDNAARWDRGCLEEWRAAHSEERRAEDAKLLAGIFNLAAKVPQLKEALDWARDHGIEFVVDRTTKKANGYYCGRTGVVALTAAVLKDPATAVGTITHEIRHAWQDWYGLLARKSGRFADYFSATAMIEADAEAFGARARAQYALRQKQESYRRGLYRLLPMKRFIAKLEKQIEASQKEPAVLWQGFISWFQRGRGYSYGLRAMENLAHEFGVPGVVPKDINAEFRPFGDRELPERAGPDFRQDDQRRRLGKGFSGANYFNGHRRTLESIFNVESCERFYSDRKRPPLMEEIRKRAMLVRLHKLRAAKHPAPA